LKAYTLNSKLESGLSSLFGVYPYSANDIPIATVVATILQPHHSRGIEWSVEILRCEGTDKERTMKNLLSVMFLATLMVCFAILAGGCQGYADVNSRVAATPTSAPSDEANPNGSGTGNDWYNLENQW
jgi:hypothetical protein